MITPQLFSSLRMTNFPVDLKYLVVKKRVQKQQVSIENIMTTLMVADPLTKGLPPKAYLEHVMRMGLLSNP